MAGHYFYDPRPFYGHNGHNGLMPLDELFYGRYEPVPYWMDQRMAPVSAFDDYYPGHKQMGMERGLPQLQQYAYKRTESRDDIGVDMYKCSPYNFNGVAGPMGYGGQQQRQSQDDTWVHAMTPYGRGQQDGNMTRTGNGNGNDQYRQMEVPMGYMPNGNMNGNNMNGNRGMEMPMNNGHMSNGKSSNMGNNGGNHGTHGNKQMSVSSNQFGNNNNGYGNGSNGFNNGSSGFSNGSTGYNNGYENGKSSSQGGHGGKSMNSKQGAKTNQRYVEDDSSSDDSDDEYENGNNNGMNWATKNSVNHGNGHQNFTPKIGSKGANQFYDSISSQNMSSKKSGGYGGSKSGGNHGSTQSKIFKLLRFQDGGYTSSSEDEGYGHSKKSSKGSSKMGSQHGSHGSFQNLGNQQQSKQMQYCSSQSKGVELKVPICCDNCERKVRECLEYMSGVENVLCDQWNRKVIVYGNVKPDNVLKRVRKVKKASELWQQAKQQQQLRVY